MFNNYLIFSIKIVQEHSDSISNNEVIEILRSRTFFLDVELLNNILEPIKNAILCLESKSSNLADCYLHLCCE